VIYECAWLNGCIYDTIGKRRDSRMCDVDKYFQMYNEIKKLQPEDTLQLVIQAKDKEEKEFFEVVSNFLLQQKQKQVIERNLF